MEVPRVPQRVPEIPGREEYWRLPRKHTAWVEGGGTYEPHTREARITKLRPQITRAAMSQASANGDWAQLSTPLSTGGPSSIMACFRLAR